MLVAGATCQCDGVRLGEARGGRVGGCRGHVTGGGGGRMGGESVAAVVTWRALIGLPGVIVATALCGRLSWIRGADR